MTGTLRSVWPAILVGVSALSSQDLSSFFRLVEQGRIEEVRQEIPGLLQQYPDNAGVMYLDAVTTQRAEEAVLAYRKLVQNHPSSPYADDAAVRIGEYLYARGLYTQASRELAKFTRLFPRSEHIQRAVDLQVSSLLAIGERDSIDYYLEFYGRKFPSLQLDYTFESDRPVVSRPLTESPVAPLTEGMTQPDLESIAGPPRPQPGAVQAEPKESEPPRPSPPRPYVVQVGAYGSIENALRQKMVLEQRGYDVEVWPLTVRGRELHAVQIVRYASRREAEKVGEKVKSSLGFAFLVLERPEKY
ncbi:MAG: SPOR domain-containing protein [Fidelibacterota bacterium]